MPYAACALALAIACICGGCARPLRSCAAYIAILGPSVLTLQCPPAGFQQQDEGADTTER